MNGCVPGLALIERFKATRKWAISLPVITKYFSYHFVAHVAFNINRVLK